MKNTFVIIWALFFLTPALRAQDYFSMGGYYGKVIKHKEALTFTIPDRSFHLQVSHKKKTSGNQYWQQFYGKPTINHIYQYVHFGDGEVLGQGHALMKGLDFHIAQLSKFTLDLSVYSGLGYITKPFDRLENPLNNAIGSHLNNATRLGASVLYRMNSNIDLSLNLHLIHFSNGLSQSPNSGINTWGLGIDLAYQIAAEENKDAAYSFEKPKIKNRWFIDVNWQYSRAEQIIPGGPKLPNHVLALGLGWKYHPLLSFMFGIDHERNNRLYEFYIRDFYTEQESKDLSTLTAIFVSNDFIFNHLTVRPQLGFYLPNPSETLATFYIKMATNYHFPSYRGIDPYVGVVLKSHATAAEYVAFSLGLRYKI